MTGTIAPTVRSRATWSDNYGGPARTGTFTGTGRIGHRHPYCGKGTALYTDANGYWYFVNVKSVNVVGSTAWYAAQIIASSSNLGFENSSTNYLFVKVTDLSEPGINKDITSGDLMTETDALAAVATW